MPAPVVARERVKLVDDDARGRRATSDARRPTRDEDRLERLWCRQQDVRRLRDQTLRAAVGRCPRATGRPSGRPGRPGARAAARGCSAARAAGTGRARTGRASSRRACARGQGSTAASVLPPAVGASSSACSPSRIGPIAASCSGSERVQPRELTRWCCSAGWRRSAALVTARARPRPDPTPSAPRVRRR